MSQIALVNVKVSRSMCASKRSSSANIHCGCTSGPERMDQFKLDGPPMFSELTSLSSADVRCVEERHLCVKRSEDSWGLSHRGIGAGRRCSYGWPQAVMCDPIWASRNLGDIVRLTCPLLDASVTAYERAGAIKRMNLLVNESDTWHSELNQINMAHHKLKKYLTHGRQDEMSEVERKMGHNTAAKYMESGLATMKLNTTDVKCLHAHVADELTRGNNAFGRRVLQDLEKLGVEIHGTQSCCDHCNVGRPLHDTSWDLRAYKTKLGQQLRKERK